MKKFKIQWKKKQNSLKLYDVELENAMIINIEKLIIDYYKTLILINEE